jgi:hypothetical protein
MPRFSESAVFATMIESKDYGSAGIRGVSVHMGKVDSISVLLSFGALTGNSILTCNASAARALTTTAIAFGYRLGAATFTNAGATLQDQFGDVIAVAAAGLTLTAATFQHKQVVIEFDSDSFTDAKPWLSLNIDATATVLNVAGVSVGRARYPGHLIPSVL